MRIPRLVAGGVAAATSLALWAPVTPAAAGAEPRSAATASDVKLVAPDIDKSGSIPIAGTGVTAATAGKGAQAAPTFSAKAQSKAVAADGGTPPVGTERQWLGLDSFQGRYYFKTYTLRGVGDNIEMWVANDIDFQQGDCRNGPRTTISDDQVAYFIHEFDTNIYPKESAAFSVPPPRDGSNAALDGDYTGGADKIVTLVDNVRDDNYYDLNNSQENTYIAGFFSSAYNYFFDRNVMTIDAFDWNHRLGANPPDNPSDSPCTNAPARPFLYEGVFAHEYQHLLESYEDPDETTWVNEGLSDFAITLTGYANSAAPITEKGFDSHIQCFLGFLAERTQFNPRPREACGPENSLTQWGDQGDGEILADYGAAYTFMLMLNSRYGLDFMSALHKNDLSGFEGLQAVLDQQAGGVDARKVFHDWTAMVALDNVLDRGARLTGGNPERYTADELSASVDFDSVQAYGTPGAPPNGSDYVRLRDAQGNYLRGPDVKSIDFDGASVLPSLPVEWMIDSDPVAYEQGVGQGPPPGAHGAALYSGTGNALDRSIVTRVTVPADDPTLSFYTYYDTEEGYDSAFVQVSTDGGKTYTSLGNDDTVSELPSAGSEISSQLPGFNGNSGGWVTETFDLSAYAGQQILLSFRYISDANTNGAGWWVDDVTLGDQLISDGTNLLETFESATQVSPIPVPGFTITLIGYDQAANEAVVLPLSANRKNDRHLELTNRFGRFAERIGQLDSVAAIVTFDDPSETIGQYAPYALRVNGVLQPGGGDVTGLG